MSLGAARAGWPALLRSAHASRKTKRPRRFGSPDELSAAAAFAALVVVAISAGGAASQWAGRATDQLGGARLVTAEDAGAFVASLGVNTHLGWADSPYADLARVEAAADFLGVRKFRDSLDSPAAVNAAAAAGIRFDLVIYPEHAGALTIVEALARTHAGAVAAVEGPNEVDAWPVTYRGVRGYPAAIAFQRALYAQVRASPELKSVPVYNVTVSGVDPAKYDALGNLSAAADYGNVHIYYGGGQPMYGWSPLDARYFWSNWLKAGELSAPGRPTVVTEVGAPTWGGGVSEAVQAKQMLNALMDAARSRVAATYVYELVDSRADPTGTDREGHFGLFRRDWGPKPAAGALRNLTTILTRGGEGPPPANRSLQYGLNGLPAQGGAHLFQQRDGRFDLVLWAEPDIWNEQTHMPIAAPATEVTVTLEKPATAAVYDPLLGSEPVQTLGPARELKVLLTDHPVIVELR